MGLLAAPLCASAGVYKCSKGGKTQYQDTPCAAGAASSEVKIQPGTAEPADGASNAGDTAAPSELDRTKAWLKRSEEHTSELQSLMRTSSAVFCLKKKKTHKQQT